MNYIFALILIFFIFWGFYLFVINFSTSIISFFIRFTKKTLFSQLDFMIIFVFSILILIFNLYVSMDISNEIITIFVFLPTVFFYNTDEKNSIMKSSIKITLWIIFIKIFFNNEIIIPDPDDVHPIIAAFYAMLLYIKSIVYANFYADTLRVLSIVLRYLNQ
ncbi:hypothetical protein [Fusobacterium nucleatum]|uniref:hypothetical protein n=1 Tax=Fusobacterium nucleatum TaxID=851 RepID=UPI0030ABCD64